MSELEKFEAFSEKWKNYITSKKNADSIPPLEWDEFFAQTNPAAGVNLGTLKDVTKRRKEGKIIEIYTNERKTIINNWQTITQKFNDFYENEKKGADKSTLKSNLKDITTYLLTLLKENEGEDKVVAINRIMVTLCREYLLTIPKVDEVIKLNKYLNPQSEGSSTDWIDLCFDIKKTLEKRCPKMMHWRAYKQIEREQGIWKNYNIILTGAPGTGKTFMARQMAANMIEVEDLKLLNNHPQFRFVQFHPSYDYTDFVEGLRPQKDQESNQIVFIRQDGIFKAFCAEAAKEVCRAKEDKRKPKPYVFVIDEINRGEISKIFGELFFSIDPGYRHEDENERLLVKTQYQNMIDMDDTLTIDNYPFKNGFYVPENVYVIGTMNDIDRSVESMDFAFRRRFSFIEIKAKDTQDSILKNSRFIDEAISRMNKLNSAIENEKYGLGSAYDIGASYFKKIDDYDGDWDLLWSNHLSGLVFEYFRGLSQDERTAAMKEMETAYKGGKKEKQTPTMPVADGIDEQAAEQV